MCLLNSGNVQLMLLDAYSSFEFAANMYDTCIVANTIAWRHADMLQAMLCMKTECRQPDYMALGRFNSLSTIISS